MVLAVYLPPAAGKRSGFPVLWWLSGLTCTDENFMQNSRRPQAGFRTGSCDLSARDTSHAVPNLPGEHDEFGTSAQAPAFYITATREPLETSITRCSTMSPKNCPAWFANTCRSMIASR